MIRFAYFTLRLRLPAGTPAGPASTGVVEDLTTGEKHEFAGPRELLELLGMERGDHSNMQPGSDPGQTRPGESA